MPEDYGPERGPVGSAAEPEPLSDKADDGVFYIPEDFPGYEDCKPGDIIHLRVVEHGDGEIGVKFAGKDKGEAPWKQDLRASMDEPTTNDPDRQGPTDNLTGAGTNY